MHMDPGASWFPPLATTYLDTASLAILYYDYVLTFSDEHDRFWRECRYSWMTWLFFCNRYVSLFGFLPLFVSLLLPWPLEKCQVLAQYRVALQIAVMGTVLAPLVFLTYALCSRNKLVLFALSALSVANMIYVAWASFGPVADRGLEENHSYFCTSWIPVPKHGIRNVLASIGFLIGIESSIFALTVYRSYRLRHCVEQPLFGIMLRNGTLYYALFTAARLSNILCITFVPFLDKGVTQNLTNVFSTVFVSRMMLHLRSPEVGPAESDNTMEFTTAHDIDMSVFRTLSFGRREC